MNLNTFTKISNGDLGCLKNTNRAGIANVWPDIGGHTPHILLNFPDGTTSGWLDADQVTYSGPPPIDYEAWALVLCTLDLQTATKPSPEEAHIPWKVEQLSEKLQAFEGTCDHWALCREPQFGNLHWLGYDVETDITIDEGITHRVKLENISPVGFEPGSDVVQASREV